jgi:hypothetical protein
MVIRTEYRGTRYCMGSSDPLPAGFEIRFGGLNFQATGNGYLMRLTNREELRARRQAGSAPVPAACTTTAQMPAGADVAGPSTPRRRRRSGQRLRQARSERRQAERAASQRGAPVSTTTTTPTGQRTVSGPCFPIGLRGATTAYNANVNTTMRRVPPGRHVFVARDPSASAVDESSLGSLDAPPPANLHGYAEWDFSGVPDPLMFRRFLDATDYWFGCSNDSSTGSYDPARECCVVIANDPANATGAVGAGDGEVTPAPGIAPRLAAGPSTPAGADADAQLAQARELEAKLAEEYRTVRLLRASMAGEASARGERARELSRQPATSSTPTLTSTTRTRLRGQVKSSLPLRHCYGLCRHPRPPRRGTCTARCRFSSSKQPSSRPNAPPHVSDNRGMREEAGLHKGANPQSTQVKLWGVPPTRDARRPMSGSLTRAGRWTVTPATSSTPGARARWTRERR